MNEIKSLTALRGLAAMAVVMQHFSATVQLHAAHSIPSLVPHGYLAVDLFFVLSGFIMAYMYSQDFADQGWRAYPNFLWKRVARIVPLNTAVVLFIVLLGMLSAVAFGHNPFYASHQLGFDTISNLFMLQGLGIGQNLNAPSWSISTEFAAYFIFPVLLGFALGPRWRAVLLWLIALGALLLAILGQPYLSLASNTTLVGLARCFAGFTSGLIAYRMYCNERIRTKLKNEWCIVPIALWLAFWIALKVDFVAVLAFPLLVLVLACNEGKVSRWLTVEPIYFLGIISFSIYLLHDFLRPLYLMVLKEVHPEALQTVPAILLAFFGALLVIPIAAWTYEKIEKPGRLAVNAFRAKR